MVAIYFAPAAAAALCSTIHYGALELTAYAAGLLSVTIQGGPRKVKPTTILLVTFQCVGKIQ